MPDASAQIVGSEQLTRIFGGWPSFHDAEVHEMQFEGSDKAQQPAIPEFPRLTTKIHLWTMTKDVDQRGYYILKNHTLATLRFYEIEELKMEGFNHQNVLFGLEISKKARDEGRSPIFAVDFDSSFGVGAVFTCQRIEVISAVPCDSEGNT